MMDLQVQDEVQSRVRAGLGILTLNRPRALNALSLAMVRELTARLLRWRDDPRVLAVWLQGAGERGLCAGGDIRFFHQAGLAGDPQVEDFFTEEYTLDHLIHRYPKPVVAWMDGIVMGGGMGLAQGATLRIVTERSQLAMPETLIGLFPDVAGGWFLSRCPGAVGEYLALTGASVGAGDAIAWGLADAYLPSQTRSGLLDTLAASGFASDAEGLRLLRRQALDAAPGERDTHRDRIDRHFAHADLLSILRSLEADDHAWARETAQALRERSPLMLCVTLEQIRRARHMTLEDALRMERGMVRRCFTLRGVAASETIEGIRALAIEKDRQPRWNPARIEDVTPEMVAPFFDSPWPAHAHPLRHLG